MEISPSSGSIGDFIDHGDGTVTDTRTGLMWMRCALGQTWDGTACAGEAPKHSWDEAMALRHSFAGYDDWRLPDIDELKSIVDKTEGHPDIDTAAFPKTPCSVFWSASAYVGSSSHAWYVDFGHGYDGTRNKTLSAYVRLVRGGQSSGALNGDAIDKATNTPAEEPPVAIQSETHKDTSIKIIDSPIQKEVPDNFVARRDGTVTYTRTGLMWMRCALGQTWDGKTCVGNAKGYTWDEAMALRHSFAGHDDWRLPDIDELKSIVDKARDYSAIDTAAFPNEPGRAFWSASAYAGNSELAWIVNSSNGGDGPGYKLLSDYVRLVRGGQSLGALNGVPVNKATNTPAEEAPVAIRVETRKNVSTNIIDLPIREETQGNFVVRSDGVATDTRTGLMWMRCALGQTWDGTACVGEAKGYTWDEAMALRHGFAGYDDWRLPNINELKSIVDKARGRPIIDIAAFPNTPKQRFWSASASAYAGASCGAWSVSFDNGHSSDGFNKTRNYDVRLVRGGQSLGTSNGDAIDKATISPVKEAPTAIRVETHRGAPTNIVDSPICEEASGNFVARSDGTVTDSRTGLMWMRCALGQTWDGTSCAGEAKGYTWNEAMALRHGFAGYDDWRLPDIDELKSIIDKNQNPLAIDTAAFPNMRGLAFWSATASAGDSTYARYVYFANGNDSTGDKAGNLQVRLVRSSRPLGILNGDSISKAPLSSVKDAPVAIQVEIRKDSPTNIIDSPIREEVPGNFVARSDGMVTDTRTGLMWMRCALGQTWDGTTCVGEAKGCSWDEAMALRHSFAGYDDWRLPSINELKSIFDKARGRPAIDTAAFPNEPGMGFWSASAYDGLSDSAGFLDFDCCRNLKEQLIELLSARIVWFLDFDLGRNLPSIKTDKGNVRLVRGDFREKLSDNFIAGRDGTVTDTRTGLMWMRCALGQTWDGTTCVGEAQKHTWDEAMALRHDFAGYDDWRLPSIDELKIITDKTRCSPTIDTAAFPNTPEQSFWSASAYADHGAWHVDFRVGCDYCGGKTGYYCVRLVRGGQSLLTLNNSASSKAIGSPVKEVSAKSIVRAAIAFIRQQPELYPAEIAELRGFLGETGAIPVSASAAAKPEPDAKPVEIPHHTTPARAPAAKKRPAPAVSETLKQVVAWLMAQETVSLSDLRAHLLPLDLLPGAVIDDLNERALDITGDPALEDDGDCIIVVREVLAQVVSAWQGQ